MKNRQEFYKFLKVIEKHRMIIVLNEEDTILYNCYVVDLLRNKLEQKHKYFSIVKWYENLQGNIIITIKEEK